jgi:hypothetical protein
MSNLAGRLLRIRVGVAAALLALAAVAPAASAYNQLIPPGGFNAIDECEGTTASPCIRWAKTASNLSINVDVYLHSSLTSQEVNLKTIALDSMGKYNAIAARNPHLQQTTSTSNEEIYVSAVSFGNPRGYGSTEFSFGAVNRIVYANIKMNTQIEWNTSYDYPCRAIPVAPHEICQADAHKVMSHEFGHAEGLAHEALSVTAIMVQGEPASEYHAVKTDDKNGIIHIYGAYP